jgi:MoaA/NifB/PqqE/SkfB family radical SAM enzyme
MVTHRVSAMPIVILMPHSACNCRCVMCDIWKSNGNTRQLSETDVRNLLESLKRLGTKQVLLSGGEALLHPRFFQLCAILKGARLSLTLLSTGLTLKHHAAAIVNAVDEVIVSLDGVGPTHDAIRNLPGAFNKLSEGVCALKEIDPAFRVSARCVIHKWNFRNWSAIVDAAKEMGLDSISFLPADVSSDAFNRADGWTPERQSDVLVPEDELPELLACIDDVIVRQETDFASGFILEAPSKIRRIGTYYEAVYGLNQFPRVRCNAPWVSAVVESNGDVKPCFFQPVIGSIRDGDLASVINSRHAIRFRRSLSVDRNETCLRCVCSLHLPPTKSLSLP